MAKKIFCDVCGDEMDYASVQPHLKADPVEVSVRGHENKPLKFEVAVRIQPKNENGGHVDVCNDCRLHILGKLDTRPRAA